MSLDTITLKLPLSIHSLKQLKVGDYVQLSGTIYTMRDVGHKRVLEYLEQHNELPFGLAGQAIFYAGPTPQKKNWSNCEPDMATSNCGRPFAAIGPTTSARMDFATPQLLAAGIKVMLGKGSRSAEIVRACKSYGSVYLATTGGAAAYLAGFVESAEMVAYPELGTEALQKLRIKNMPAFVAIDTEGYNLYDQRK